MTKKMNIPIVFFLACLLFTSSSCGLKQQNEQENVKDASNVVTQQRPAVAPQTPPLQLPVRYQTLSYKATSEISEDELLGGTNTEYRIKVGATIRSTSGPQPLREVLKRLVNLKGMTVSWASDVEQTTLVDVDIAANDYYYDAIENMLRQADYFHEVKGKNVIIRNKATRVYQIGVPAMRGGYTTSVGGNFLANKEAASGTEGAIKISSVENEFNIWDSIEANLKAILQTAEDERAHSPLPVSDINMSEKAKALKYQSDTDIQSAREHLASIVAIDGSLPGEKRRSNVARDGSSFFIDKNIGLITVTAKLSTLETVDNYIENLKKYLYQQISIEAKIIEVYLEDNLKFGIDWSSVLKDKPISGTVSFGNGGQVYPQVGSFVSTVALAPFNFEVMLNALNEQGDSHVLSNPKLTVLNGQPALISVGTDIAYVKQVSSDKDSDENNSTITYTAEVGNVVQGVALGVMATIRDGKTIVMHLTPITTALENRTAEGNVPLATIGLGDTAIQLGLPQVKVRQMSTMVEVEDGEMLVIGGLIDSFEEKTESFTPVLGSIPVVKYLFGYEEKIVQKRELVILLVPKII